MKYYTYLRIKTAGKNQDWLEAISEGLDKDSPAYQIIENSKKKPSYTIPHKGYTFTRDPYEASNNPNKTNLIMGTDYNPLTDTEPYANPNSSSGVPWLSDVFGQHPVIGKDEIYYNGRVIPKKTIDEWIEKNWKGSKKSLEKWKREGGYTGSYHDQAALSSAIEQGTLGGLDELEQFSMQSIPRSEFSWTNVDTNRTQRGFTDQNQMWRYPAFVEADKQGRAIAKEVARENHIKDKRLSYLKWGLGGAALGGGLSALKHLGDNKRNLRRTAISAGLTGLTGLGLAYLHNKWLDRYGQTPLESLYWNSPVGWVHSLFKPNPITTESKPRKDWGMLPESDK